MKKYFTHGHKFYKEVNKSNKYDNIILSLIINTNHSNYISLTAYSLLCIIILLIFSNGVYNDICNLSFQDNPIIIFNIYTNMTRDN